MTTQLMSGLLLKLYPRPWRRRFAREWLELVEWRAGTLDGRRFPRLRLAIGLLIDTARALPEAYLLAARDWLKTWFANRSTTRQGARSTARQPNGDRPPRHRIRFSLTSLLQDLQYAARGLLRNPLFAAAAVASLALGIGANTAIFSVVNAVLLEPLPYREPDRLAIVWNEFPSSGLVRLPVSGVELQALRDHPNLFEDVGGIWATTRTVLGLDEPVTVPSGLITPNFFSVLGVEPRLGRAFLEDEDGSVVPRGVILSAEFWRSHFGADPAVIERTLSLDGDDVPVLGVMPPGFTLHFPPDGGIPARLDLYTPLPWNLSELPPDQRFLRVLGRLRSDVDIQHAEPQVRGVAQQLRETYPALAANGDEFTIVPLHADTVRATRPVLLVLLVGVGLFLLLATANVASLMLARTTTRGKEMAIRVSIGASRTRLAQMLVVESLIITALGACVGYWLGKASTGLLWALRPEGITRIDTIDPDPAVLAFTAGVSAIAAIAFGLAPITQLSSFQPIGSLRSSGAFTTRRSLRARKFITATEVALGFVLLIGASLMIQTFSRLQRADIGFDTERLLTFKVALALQRFPDDVERARLARELERSLQELPGVISAGATSHLPFALWANWGGSAAPEGVSEAERDAYFVDHRSVTPSYIGALGARLITGRSFLESDDQSSDPVIIIDRTYAVRAFGTADAVGKRLFATRYREDVFENVWAVIVGVIDDVRDRSPAQPSSGQVFWPFAQSARWELTYVVRTAGDPADLVDDVRAAIASLQRNLAASDIRVMESYYESATAQNRFVALLGGAFSALAFVLAMLGVYGVVTYSTTQRSHEVGVRVALGAKRGHILTGVLREGVTLGLAGIVVGVIAAFGSTRFLGAMLYGVSPMDPATFGGVSLAFLVVTIFACLGPAWRATKVDPLESIR